MEKTAIIIPITHNETQLKKIVEPLSQYFEGDILFVENPVHDSNNHRKISIEYKIKHHFICSTDIGENLLKLFLSQNYVLLQKYDTILTIENDLQAHSENLQDSLPKPLEHLQHNTQICFATIDLTKYISTVSDMTDRFVELTNGNFLDETKKSNSALIVKEISQNMYGTTFHHHINVLYDIRTVLGPKPITYLEIGSYEGGSMSVMLTHPYKSTIHCIDPFDVHDRQFSNIENNSKKFNKHDYDVTFYKNFSNESKLIQNLRRKNLKADMLFIDGDHTKPGVFCDFFLYHEFLSERGFIVFDDYNDAIHSPQVKMAVDAIQKQLPANCFDIWKDFPNYQNAFICENYKYFNECIFRKKQKIQSVNEKPVIIIATYNRPNGSTKNYLKRSIDSILNQTYENWTIIVVGDSYDNPEELDELIMSYRKQTKNEIVLLHNYISERHYLQNPRYRWAVAGTVAMNMGLLYARQNGYKYYFHLDDDDFWEPNHIQCIMEVYHKYPMCVFANTKSSCIDDFLPNDIPDTIEIKPNNRIANGADTIHSSFSFRIDVIPYNYITNFYDNDKIGPGDYLMIASIRDFVESHTEYCEIYVPVFTCHHDQEFNDY